MVDKGKYQVSCSINQRPGFVVLGWKTRLTAFSAFRGSHPFKNGFSRSRRGWTIVAHEAIVGLMVPFPFFHLIESLSKLRVWMLKLKQTLIRIGAKKEFIAFRSRHETRIVNALQATQIVLVLTAAELLKT